VLRVLRVIARLNVGGPAIHVGLLTARLDPARFDSMLATGTPAHHEGDMFDLRPSLRDEVGARLVIVPGLGRDVSGAGDVRAVAALSRLIRSFRPHIVHTHTAKAGAIGRVLARVHRVPVVVHTFHGTVFAGHFRPGVGQALAQTERALARLTDQLLAVSPAVARDLEDRRIGRIGRGVRGVRGVRVVPLGLDLDPLALVPPVAPDAAPTVTLVARLVPVKDVPLFIAAAGIARERVPGLRVQVAGDGQLRGELERDAPGWVRFLGFQSDLASLLAGTTAVALSSRSEGSPVALIEGLAAGRPVAAVPVGGVNDVLAGRAGAVLAAGRTPAALADAIVDAVGNPERAAAAQSGRAAVIAEYGADRLVSDMSALYDELWAARRRG
jgi:glycosyltransferase involved in cell wall biosynthesis